MVTVVDPTSGCLSTLTVNVPDDSVLPLVTLTQTPNNVCDIIIAGGFNGTVTVVVEFPTGNIEGDFTDYDMDLFAGDLPAQPSGHRSASARDDQRISGRSGEGGSAPR